MKQERLLSRDLGGSPLPRSRLLCSVARVSSWLFRMMVWEAVGMVSEAVLPSELCSLCMWNLRWPFRLNLQVGEGCPHSAAKTRTPPKDPPKGRPPGSPLAADVAGEGLLVGVRQHVSAQVLLVLGGKAAVLALVGPEAGMLLQVALRGDGG